MNSRMETGYYNGNDNGHVSLQMTRPVVSIVCSDKSRNGKTLLATLLADYLIHEKHKVSVFDLDSPGGDLATRFEGHATIIDLSRTPGIMALFDTIMANPTRDYVVDLPQHQLRDFFSLTRGLGFVEAARDAGMTTSIMFLCDPLIPSINQARGLRNQNPGASFVIVRNEAVRILNSDENIALAYKELCRPGCFVLPHMSKQTGAFIADSANAFSAYFDDRSPENVRRKHYTAYPFFSAIIREFERLQFMLDLDRWKTSSEPE